MVSETSVAALDPLRVDDSISCLAMCAQRQPVMYADPKIIFAEYLCDSGRTFDGWQKSALSPSRRDGTDLIYSHLTLVEVELRK